MDELVGDDGTARPAAAALLAMMDSLGVDTLVERQHVAELDILTMGITFTVYSDGQNIDRAWPFDIIPRVIPGAEWDRTSAGLAQRLRALNLFIDDLYNDQRIVADDVFPDELLAASVNFRPQCRGVRPKHGVWAHISGTDQVRDDDGVMYELEDNLRVPSGVSYVLENRAVAKRAFGELFARQQIRPVDGYTDELKRLLISLAPDGVDDPHLAVLTPGIYNSAYFEHSFLAQRMGAELVEGADLVVGEDDCVYMRTIAGLERVHVIYRRIDDHFLDPEVSCVAGMVADLVRLSLALLGLLAGGLGIAYGLWKRHIAATLERMDPFERMRYQSAERRKQLLDEMIEVEWKRKAIPSSKIKEIKSLVNEHREELVLQWSEIQDAQ
mgnify:CR=1 FL=1